MCVGVAGDSAAYTCEKHLIVECVRRIIEGNEEEEKEVVEDEEEEK